MRSTSRPGWAVTIATQSAPVLRPALAQAVLGERGHEVVVIGDVRPLVDQQANDLHAGRLAHVPHAGLVGDADDRDPRAAHRLGVVVERPRDRSDAEVGHALVDLAGELDELGLHVELARAPGEVEGVDRRQWPPMPGPGLNDMKP